MDKPSLPPPILVDTPEKLASLLEHLSRHSIVAVDTESNSLYAYRERVCLIQVSTSENDYLVDPLALDDLSPLGPLFADPKVEKVFHAAEYDVMVLRRDFGFSFANLFDTMIACRIVGWKPFGLAALLKQHFGVHTDKRFQQANWGRRPLLPEMLTYAQLDTHYLIGLRHRLLAELQRLGRVEQAREAFERVAHVRWRGHSFDPEGFRSVKGAHRLAPAELAVLRELYRLRDEEARRLDCPPFKVMSDAVLIRLSQVQPRTVEAFRKVRGVSTSLPRKAIHRWIEAIERGIRADRPHLASPEPPPPEEELDRYEALRAWRRRVARRERVDPDVILSNKTLHAIARLNPQSYADLAQSRILSERELEAFGQEIITALEGVQSE